MQIVFIQIMKIPDILDVIWNFSTNEVFFLVNKCQKYETKPVIVAF